MSSWYNKVDVKNSAVISSRIRLARNIKGIPFPARTNDTQKLELLDKFKSVFDGSKVNEVGTLKFIDMATVPEEELMAMVERHIISPDFAKKQGPKGLVISDDETVSVMLLEEDHIRIQVLLGGMELIKAYEIALEVEALLGKNLLVAFDSQLGYLTQCPTNLGTGLRASLMLHLPLLEGYGSIAPLAESVSKIGLTVRGMYGEGSRSHGGLYQLSNQVTLGISENAAIENLTAIANQIVQKEYSARDEVEKSSIADNVFRALGTLKYARKITSDEAIKLLSLVKLGVSMGIIDEVKPHIPMQLIIKSKPVSLQTQYGRMTPSDRDVCRANFIREQI